MTLHVILLPFELVHDLAPGVDVSGPALAMCMPIPKTSAVPAAFLIKVRRERLAAGVDLMDCELLGSVFIGVFYFRVKGLYSPHAAWFWFLLCGWESH